MHIAIAALHRPIQPTGVCRHAVNVARALSTSPNIEKVTLIVGRWQLRYFQSAFDLSHPKIQLASIDIENRSVWRNVWFMFGLPKVVQQLQPDLLHLSFPLPFFRKLFNIPVVSSIHDFYVYDCPENFGYPQVWFNQWFLKQCISNSDRLACVSQATLSTLRQYFPQSHRIPASVVYNYVDFSRESPVSPPEGFPADGSPFLLCVAQHRKNKNLDVLIRAYEQQRQAGVLTHDTKLVLVGSEGPETAALSDLVRACGLQAQVIFLSGISDAQLRWLYENARLFVMASSIEGFCVPLVEAISFGCRVVCSDIPIFRELGLSDSTFFSLEHPVENLSIAIAAALQTSQPSRQTKFSMKETARQCLSFYFTPHVTDILESAKS